MTENLKVTRSLTIPGSELSFTFSTSGGPGGQHANKVATRAEVSWNVDDSAVLGPRQRERIRSKLRRRIDSNGNLRLASDTHRSQMRNREEVRKRLALAVADALRVQRQRTATKPSKASVERRLQAKKRRSEIKKNRQADRHF